MNYNGAHLRIDEYGLIGDMTTAALVGVDGSIDWCCMPRFDSPSVFAAILDGGVGGRFRIAPAERTTARRQAYLRDTNILETTFVTESGELSVTDFMPLGEDVHSFESPGEIHRVARCVSGDVSVRCDFEPRPDYARAKPVFSKLPDGVRARGGGQTLNLLSDIPLTVSEGGGSASAVFTLSQGQTATFVLDYGDVSYGDGSPRRLSDYATRDKLEWTRLWWRSLVAFIQYDGVWREAVVRSMLALRLMVYRRTGAIVAAPTTSLPETIGGGRNWDYRFSWLRDASFTVEILYKMGDVDEGAHYIKWLLEQCRLNSRRTQILYGISPESSLKEETLDHLAGYADSKPVRIGNGAADHIQMDVFGEVILALHSMYGLTGEMPSGAWPVVSALANTVMRNWRRKDRGVWEVRGELRDFVYSKTMCWVALDRAAQIAEIVGERQRANDWARVAATIRAEILRNGWSDSKRAFRQHYDSDTVDASNLAIPFLGLLPPDDPRILPNLQAIERELADGPFVIRYLPSETDDGLGGQEEGAFTLLSFWLIGNLIYTGQVERAEEYFERMLASRNHLGLYSEMIDPSSGEFLGNFPQAYSHIGLLHTARNLSAAKDGQESA